MELMVGPTATSADSEWKLVNSGRRSECCSGRLVKQVGLYVNCD